MSLKEIIRLIFLRKKIITYFASFFLVINIFYIVLTDELYDSKATILPISSSGNSLDSLGGGLGGLFNFNLDPSQSTSFSPDVYPVILTSKKLSDSLLNQNFEFNDKQQTLFSILSKNKSFKNDLKRDQYFDKLSKKLRTKIIKVSHNQFTDVIKVTVQSLSPELSQAMLSSTIEATQLMNDEIFAQKESEKLSFLISRIDEIENDVELLDNKLVKFKETNRGNLSSPMLSLEQEKIRRELDIKKNVLISLNQQYELLAIHSKDNTSILYTIDPPSFPTDKSHPQVLLFSLISIIVGSILGFFIAPKIDNHQNW